MNCNYDVLFDKISLSKLTKEVEATLEVLTDLPFCKTINTRKIVAFVPTTEGQTPVNDYKPFDTPINAFECRPRGCKTTGTLYAGIAGDAIFKMDKPATEFSSGVLTFYVKTATNSSVTVKLSDAQNFTNSDSYTVDLTNIPADANGFKPVIVDLSKTPTTTTGTGWTASDNGVFISISTDPTMGISTIAVFDSMQEFATSTIVKIGCLSELSGDEAIDAAEETCMTSGYDESSAPQFDRTVVGKKVTPNYWMLHPMTKKSEVVEDTMPVNREFTITESGNNGIVTLTDINQDECGFIAVQIADPCRFTDITADAELTRLIVPTLVDLEKKEYVAINNNDGTTTLYFNKELVGVDVKVAYPKLVEVEQLVADREVIGEKIVRYIEKVTTKRGDGKIESVVVSKYDNVLVTSFPNTINEEETEFSFTIRVQQDMKGHYFTRSRVIE